MNRKQLENYIPAGQEIQLIKMEMGHHAVTDRVMGSLKEFPYTLHPIKVEGIQPEALDKFEALMARLKRERLEVEAFITEVEDSRIRQILTLRYMKGLTWAQVALKVGGNNTDDGVRKAASRYIEGGV